MMSIFIRFTLLLVFILHTSVAVFAHPTGNMLRLGETVFWSYINPINDPDHKACIMRWEKGAAPQVFLQSDFAASDYMLSKHMDLLYIIERRTVPGSEDFEIRLLKTSLTTPTQVIWDWFKDDFRIGEGGFYMRSETELIFGKYPSVYALKKGGTPVQYFDLKVPVKKIRPLDNHQILLVGDEACYLANQDGSIDKAWLNLIDPSLANPPLGRNQLFDADYQNGVLLYAYWGKRAFGLVNKQDVRAIILKQEEPFTPHWVAFFGADKLLFSSRLVFDGRMPTPLLVRLSPNNQKEILWNIRK